MITAFLKVDEQLKRLQRLQRPFEADRSRLDTVLRRRLRHDRADEIVGKNMRPHLFTDEFRRLAIEKNQGTKKRFVASTSSLEPTCGEA